MEFLLSAIPWVSAVLQSSGLPGNPVYLVFCRSALAMRQAISYFSSSQQSLIPLGSFQCPG